MLQNIEVIVENESKPNFDIKQLSNKKKKATSHEISDLLHLVCSRFNDYDSQTSKELKNALEEIKRLENFINNLKKRPCSKCAKLIEITESLKKTLKDREDTIAVIGKLLTNNPSQNSYALASQMVNDVIMSPAADLTYFDNDLLPEAELFYKADITLKTPEKSEETNTEVSPVVLKRTRSNKRRLMNISSKKKNKTENCNIAANAYEHSYLDDDAEFAELSLLNIASGSLKTPENYNITKCITPLSSMNHDENSLEQSPEILNKTIGFRKDHLSSGEKFSDFCEKSKLSLEVKTTDFKFNSLLIEKKCSESATKNAQESSRISPELMNKSATARHNLPPFEFKTDPTNENCQPKALSPLNVNVMNNVNAATTILDHSKNTNAVPSEKSKQKALWNLKKSRELTSNKKLKQTVLSTIVREKKLDISTLEEYNGGSIPCSQIKKSEVTVGCSGTDKENMNYETFFEPLATSTDNYLHNGHGFNSPSKPIVQVPTLELRVQENKLKSPEKKIPTEPSSNHKTPIKEEFARVEDSFDCISPRSPKYAYRRDAIRKKSDRLKLPGQECAKCMNFYESRKSEMSGTQIRTLLNKCSRHRDKYPINLNTPPGMWNPVFDDTDDETEVK